MPLRLRSALAIVAATLVPAAGASAAAPGLNVLGDVGDPAHITKALSTDAKEIRIFANWAQFEPNDAGDFTTTSHEHEPGSATYKYFASIKQIKDAGRKVMVVITGAPSWANGSNDTRVPPSADHVADFRTFVGEFVARAAANGSPIDEVEIWNEPDGGEYWQPGPDPGRYVQLLKAAYEGVKSPTGSGDARVQVFTGPTAGSSYAWIQSLYDNGAQGFFDGVSVHSDTACLVAGPDEYYRDSTGRIGFTSFLAFREVHDVMAAHGDGNKPIAMSEIGWSSTGGGPTSCARGSGTGIKANGVSADTQAQFLAAGYRCLANYPYVTQANWFQLADESTDPGNELGHYGLFDTAGNEKPALAAFKAVAQANGGAGGPCGDFDPPALTVLSPTANQTYDDKLNLQATATDAGVGVSRIQFFVDGATKAVSSFSDGFAGGAPVGLTPWYGSAQLALGPHVIKVVATDKAGNAASQTVTVTKVVPKPANGSLAAKLSIPKKPVGCKKFKKGSASCVFTLGKLTPPALTNGAVAPVIAGRVQIEWQLRGKKGKYKKVAGGVRLVRGTVKFSTKLRRKGAYRVRVKYLGQGAYKPFTTRFFSFTVR